VSNDRAILGRVVRELAAMAGTCEHCGCSGDTCSLPEGGKCVWMNRSRTCCSGPGCIRAHNKKYPQRGRAARLFRNKGRAA